MRLRASGCDPTPAVGSFQLRGLTAGPGITVAPGNSGDVVMSAAPFAPVSCVFRLSDVVASAGQFRLSNNTLRTAHCSVLHCTTVFSSHCTTRGCELA